MWRLVKYVLSCMVRSGMWVRYLKFQGTWIAISDQQYKGSSAALNRDGIGVLCSWFSPVKWSKNVFQICDNKNSAHTHIPISCYLCSVCTNDCLQVVQTSSCQGKSIMHSASGYQKIAAANKILLSEESLVFIADCFLQVSTVTPKPHPSSHMKTLGSRSHS